MRACACGFIAAALIGFAASASLYVQDFHADLVLSSQGSLRVVETLTVVFQTAHHGIERYIPVSYRTPVGTRVTIGFHLDDVTMDGARVPTARHRSGGREYIRVGDPDTTLVGTHVYRIAYSADRVLLFHQNDLQLYWNVTGNDWEIPIRQASATLTLPSGLSGGQVSAVSYSGYFGAAGPGQPVSLNDAGQLLFSTGILNQGSGFTIDLSIPRDLLTIQPPTFLQNLSRSLWDNKLAALPIAAFILMLVLWFRLGRDPQKGVIAPAVEPPSDLGPGEAGVLVDDRMDLRDVSAMVIGLAVGGYLAIREESMQADSLADKARAWVDGSRGSYTFVRGRRPPADLALPEKALYEAIFPDADTKETPLDALENRFYKHLPTIRLRLFDEVIRKKLYARNPERTRGTYAGWGGALVAAGVGLGVLTSSLYVAVAIALSGLVVVAFSPIMPRKTQKGVAALADVLGLAEYIQRAEVKRIEFTDAPAKSPEHFEKLLPYAVALGLTTIWVRQFEGLLSQPPQWYVGASTFNGHLFGLSLGRLSSGMQSTFVSAPRTAPSSRSAWGGRSTFGGGFSGGGFGGGGGRGW